MASKNSTIDIFPPLSSMGIYYILIPFTGLCVIGSLIALVLCIRRKRRLDQLRHKLIPMYSYDPAEHEVNSEEDWDSNDKNEEEQETEPLFKDNIHEKSSFKHD